jgi:hypothetical protein
MVSSGPRLDARRDESVFRWEHRLPRPTLRHVGVVAVDAMVAQPRPPGEVPVTAHPAVAPAEIVLELRPVALGAEAQCFCRVELRPIGEVELRRAAGARHVAGAAGERAVVDPKTDVKLPELLGAPRKRAALAQGMARPASDSHGPAEPVAPGALYGRELRRLVEDRLRRPGARRWLQCGWLVTTTGRDDGCTDEHRQPTRRLRSYSHGSGPHRRSQQGECHSRRGARTWEGARKRVAETQTARSDRRFARRIGMAGIELALESNLLKALRAHRLGRTHPGS